MIAITRVNSLQRQLTTPPLRLTFPEGTFPRPPESGHCEVILYRRDKDTGEQKKDDPEMRHLLLRVDKTESPYLDYLDYLDRDDEEEKAFIATGAIGKGELHEFRKEVLLPAIDKILVNWYFSPWPCAGPTKDKFLFSENSLIVAGLAWYVQQRIPVPERVRAGWGVVCVANVTPDELAFWPKAVS